MTRCMGQRAPCRGAPHHRHRIPEEASLHCEDGADERNTKKTKHPSKGWVGWGTKVPERRSRVARLGTTTPKENSSQIQECTHLHKIVKSKEGQKAVKEVGVTLLEVRHEDNP